MLLVTGPVTQNMREALKRTYDATPAPKWVVAIGTCALDGGLYRSSCACVGGVSDVIPVDLHIPGCPPAPLTLIRGLLALMAKGQSKSWPAIPLHSRIYVMQPCHPKTAGRDSDNQVLKAASAAILTISESLPPS